MMHEYRESDSPIVSKKPANNVAPRGAIAEPVEKSGLAKENPNKTNKARTQRRTTLQNGLARIRQAVRRNRTERLTSLWHHIYNQDRLAEAYYKLNRKAASGVDNVPWQDYGLELASNLTGLSSRLKQGSYHARVVERHWIPKSDGKQRPIGVLVLEDKIAQASTTKVLNAVYEKEFKGFSYGFRPGRSQHRALDALSVALVKRKINWVLDADIRGFFDRISHEWLMEFIEHRIADKRVLRHIKKWLNAGVLDAGKVHYSTKGTPQGGSISPLLANIYLHYVLDLWIDWWRTHEASGDIIIVRYADDFIVGFQYYREAVAFQSALSERLAKFNLELHPEKTRLIEFGRFAIKNRKQRGQKKPATFDFLGFTHMCSHTRYGVFVVRRKTIKERRRHKLKEIKIELRKRMHQPKPVVGKWLRQVLFGYYHYFGVPLNNQDLRAMRRLVTRLWFNVLNRRSQKNSMNWEQMNRLVDKWLPPARIYHPFPTQRLVV